LAACNGANERIEGNVLAMTDQLIEGYKQTSYWIMIRSDRGRYKLKAIKGLINEYMDTICTQLMMQDESEEA
jgi:hypothetical protein